MGEEAIAEPLGSRDLPHDNRAITSGATVLGRGMRD